MIDPRLAWFAIGATCSAVVFGWPWHPRFSRLSRRMGPPRGSLGYPFWDYIPDSQGDTPRCTPPDPRRRINHENTAPDSSEQRPRWFRRGSNPSAPGTKPEPPASPPANARSISFPDPAPDRQPTNPFTDGSVLYYRREYLHSPSTVAECGGPCKAGPEHCHCGQLWRDVPVRFDRGTPKPAIVPKPQFPPPRVIPGDTP